MTHSTFSSIILQGLIQGLAILIAVWGSSVAIAQDRPDIEALTLEWIYSDASSEIAALPKYAWLDDGDALILDVRKPIEDRTIERLDPETGQRTPAVDRERALASLNALRDSSRDDLPWPLEFGPEGRRALYAFGGDLFLLDLEASTFQRLTETDAEEIVPRLAPDGSRVAFVRENDLYMIDIESEAEIRLTDDGGPDRLNGTVSWVYWEEIFGRQDIGYWWSDDSRAIAYFQTDESPVGRVRFVDFAPQTPRVLEQRYPKAGTANPIVRLGVVEISGDNIRDIDAEVVETNWISIPDEYEYLVRVKWLPDSERLSFQTMNRAQDELRLYFADRDGDAVDLVLTETDPAWINVHDDLDFLEGGSGFLWASERDGYCHLYRYDLDGTLQGRLTEGDWALRASGSVFWLRRTVAAVVEESQQVYFTALKDSSIEKHLYRIGFDGGDPVRISQEPGTHTVTFDPSGNYYFDAYSNISTPPSLTLRRADGSKVLTLAEPNTEPLQPFAMRYPEQFTIPASDGFPMPAELLTPQDYDPNKTYPLILYVYGGPSAPTVANAWRQDIYFDQLLLDHGYLVARIDNRISTAISHALESTALQRMSGPIERSDVLDGIAQLKARPDVDPDRVGVWGWSGGGSFTLNLMTHSDQFRAGIAVAAVTDWRYYDTKWAEFAMKRPQDNPEGYAETSFVDVADDLDGRLLLVHGTYDDNVHPQNAWAFADALIDAGIVFDMMIYPMRKHGIADRPARIHLFRSMLDFWDRNL